MHQDSQNFSDIMAINTTKKLVVEIEIATHGDIVYQMLLNNNPIIELHNIASLNLFDDVDFSIKILENKNNSAVEIKKLIINGKEVLPLYQHLASENTCWIRQGEWNYFISSPFYSWYHNASGQGWIA